MKKLLAALMVVASLGSMMTTSVVAANDQYEGIEITVNINNANEEELEKLLLGIGPDKAAKIIEYRDANGPFLTADDLSKVRGVGPATVEKNRERIEL